MRQQRVRKLQKLLNDRGFDPGPIDGIFGPHTQAAIFAFQKEKGLTQTSHVSDKMWGMLDNPRKIDPAAKDLPWMIEAKRVLGKHEVRDNEFVKYWLASDGHALGDPAELPWCGDFVETAIRLTLPNEKIPKNPYWALNWLKFGKNSLPTYGCIAAIKRKGGGHVMFLVGQDEDRYYALGGNQKNMCSVVPVSKLRFNGNSFRWPSTFPSRKPGLPYMKLAAKANTQEG